MMRTVLDNGMTVVLEPRGECSRVGVTVHYGVGFRNEGEGWEGFAHLFEHLMFRGSENFPDGSFYHHVYESAGDAGGNTHQDYTDYYQRVPAERLEDALFAEADRMRAPTFAAEAVAEQIAGVAAEITGATISRPYGGFPWPLISEATFRHHANAHDGYGSIDALTTVTPQECHAFFERHYRPSNATLTVVGGIDVNATLALIKRLFGGIDGGSAPAPISRPREVLTAHRHRRWREPGIDRPAMALSMCLPDPATDLHGYLTGLVFTRLARDRSLGHPGIDVSCGIFGPLDVADQDIMIAAALVEPHTPPDAFVAAVEAGWSDCADSSTLAADTSTAIAAVITEYTRAQQDLGQRTRTLGKMTTLFGRPQVADEIGDRLRRITADDVRSAAKHYSTCAKGVLVLAPGPERTRPHLKPGIRILP